MNEHNNHLYQSPGESAPQAPHSLVPQLLARLGLDASSRALDASPESLGKAIFHPVWTVRAAAAEALANRSDQQSLKWLLSALHDEDDFSSRLRRPRARYARGRGAFSRD